jgi:predicted outer membrane protein
MRFRPAAAVLLALVFAACGEDLTETKPPEHGGDRSLSRTELRWCMFNDLRIEAARPDMRTAKQGQVQAFNAAVTEWNQGCRRYRYRRSDRDAVQSQLAQRRLALEAEGRARFAATPVN